jgi:hypothetical protein
LILAESGQSALEGWAIVDNTTGDDWSQVKLALVSGRPVSFISQLYAPKYVTRQVAELADDQAAGPVVYEGGYADDAKDKGAVAVGGLMNPMSAPAAPPPPAVAKRAFAPMAMQRMKSEQEPQFAPRSQAESTLAVNTATRELGDLFEYRLENPVTIRKNESAMLPFLQQKIDARKLLIYSARGSEHPMNAAEISNSSGKTLDGGPITVYDAGAYAGEALMETLKSGDKRLISYAVDLGTRVTEAFDSKAEVVRELHAQRGILTTKAAVEEIRNYTIKNVDQKAKTLVIEHPLRQGYTLLNQKPAEKTSSAYRFEVKLAAGATEKFPVSEERVYFQSVAVVNLTPDVIVAYLENKNLSPAGKQKLQAIADRKNQLAALMAKENATQLTLNSVSKDEDRIRQNIQSLNRVEGQQQQVQKYAQQLSAAETQMTQLRDQEADLQKKRQAAEAEVNQLVNALEF